jgi:HTH-type transcriptional regulator/antitoxin HipB
MHPITSTQQVGALLTARRKHLALTQEQAASRMGLSQNRLSVLESRPGSLTLEQLLALLNLLGLQLRIDERPAAKPGSEW